MYFAEKLMLLSGQLNMKKNNNLFHIEQFRYIGIGLEENQQKRKFKPCYFRILCRRLILRVFYKGTKVFFKYLKVEIGGEFSFFLIVWADKFRNTL